MPHGLSIKPMVFSLLFILCIWGQITGAETSSPTTSSSRSEIPVAASRPVTAMAPIVNASTEPLGVRPGEMVDVEGFDQSIIHAYFVTPKGPGPYPAIILLHDIYGLTPWHKKEADLYAGMGYAVVVPNLYSRDPQMLEGTADARVAWLAYNNMPDAQALKDIRAFVSWLGEQSAVMDKPIGAVGYSMGGIYTMGLAAIDLRIKAAVNFYGRLEYHETTVNRPASPVDALFNLTAPMISFYGTNDPSSPAVHVAKLEKRLFENPNKTFYQIIRYPGVGHNFMNDGRQGYDAEARADALKKVEAFLDRNLKNAKPKKDD